MFLFIGSIPTREKVKLKWIAVIGRELHKQSRVCSNHFAEGDFSYKVVGDNVRKCLLPEAVPIIHGHSDSKSVQRQTMMPNNSDSNNVSIPQVDQSLTSESNLSIDSHNKENESMKGDESHESKFNTLSDKEMNEVKQQNVLVAKKSSKNSDDDITLENQQDLTIDEENESMEGDESHKSKFNILSDKEMNEVKQQNVLVAKKSSKNSDDDITLENQQDLIILKKSSLIRQSSDTRSLTSVKRVCNARYLGNLTREDFTSDIAYATVNDYLTSNKRKEKILNQKLRRLIQKVKSLQSLLNHQLNRQVTMSLKYVKRPQK
ncbi:uncharacterized protein LOC143212105 isoform X2 [Lasioglossum baleicum]|uniref:uncharacterized protein LOC143212105 isoform X2 n=1 Tax=Lasioglossum baleicum TaxID=434251 RepID=UPI003FCCE20F